MLSPRSAPYRWASKLRHRGPLWALRAAAARVRPPRLSTADALRDLVRGQHAIEIGGPSYAFGPKGLLPLYDALGTLDLVDYSETTVWTESGQTDRDQTLPAGRLIVAEATELSAIADEQYDFLFNAGVLEHLADPLRGLGEWRRVLRPGGRLLVLLPRGEETFDRRRPITTTEHLMADRGRDEDDATHVSEVLRLYDHARAEEILTREELVELCQRNAEARWMHHHVFDERLGQWAMEQAGFTVEWIDYGWPFWICILARRRPQR